MWVFSMNDCLSGSGNLSEELELPEWVQTLIEAEKEKAYDKGRRDGERWQYAEDRRALERADPR